MTGNRILISFVFLSFLLLPMGLTEVSAEEVHCSGYKLVYAEHYTDGFPKYRTQVEINFGFEYDCSDEVAHIVGAVTDHDCNVGFWYSYSEISCQQRDASPGVGCAGYRVYGEWIHSNGGSHHWIELEVEGCDDGTHKCIYPPLGGNPPSDPRSTCDLVQHEPPP